MLDGDQVSSSFRCTKCSSSELSHLYAKQHSKPGSVNVWNSWAAMANADVLGEQKVIDYHGAEIVSLRLLSLVKEEFLFLSPNLDSRGLQCASSPHGLVMVGVAGTVHRGNTCLGIFEQIFGLIRCPFVENTWKIKFINLRIVGESSLAPGTLPKPAITFEPSDLEAFYNVVTLCGTSEVRFNVKQAFDSGTGDQALCSGNEALLNKRELSLPNPVKH
ncbi:uncharacterized protein C3orf38 homolog [Tupaia chinensis]|uniref:uncharacterized protein C3orf38 homolog n=1 Tax=Tupaia chinensis TaxID=246437 RepID=UPI0003C8D5CC|nr:uncharacterized protein C3orf38 homolog [Tupaia chinensis]